MEIWEITEKGDQEISYNKGMDPEGMLSEIRSDRGNTNTIWFLLGVEFKKTKQMNKETKAETEP